MRWATMICITFLWTETHSLLVVSYSIPILTVVILLSSEALMSLGQIGQIRLLMFANVNPSCTRAVAHMEIVNENQACIWFFPRNTSVSGKLIRSARNSVGWELEIKGAGILKCGKGNLIPLSWSISMKDTHICKALQRMDLAATHENRILNFTWFLRFNETYWHCTDYAFSFLLCIFYDSK